MIKYVKGNILNATEGNKSNPFLINGRIYEATPNREWKELCVKCHEGQMRWFDISLFELMPARVSTAQL